MGTSLNDPVLLLGSRLSAEHRVQDHVGRLALRAAKWMCVSGALWTAVFLVDVGLWVVIRSPDQPLVPSALHDAVVWRGAQWFAWWLLTPAVFLVARRFRFEAGRRLPSLVAHLAAAITVSALRNVIIAAVERLSGAGLPTGMLSTNLVSLALFSDVVRSLTQYVCVAGLAMVLAFRRLEREHVDARARLETQLARSRERALTFQLQPHFLFNALNGVAMLMRAEAHGEALKALLGYGELLRLVLDTDTPEIPLSQELAFIERYLAIERMRFPDTLSAEVRSAPGLSDALIPSLVLQPLVENAMRHGLSDVEHGARLEVIAMRHHSWLRLEVRDNGRGLPPGWTIERTKGVGLRNTVSRLRERYGDAFHFELETPAERGTTVIIELPFRLAAPQPRESAGHVD